MVEYLGFSPPFRRIIAYFRNEVKAQIKLSLSIEFTCSLQKQNFEVNKTSPVSLNILLVCCSWLICFCFKFSVLLIIYKIDRTICSARLFPLCSRYSRRCLVYTYL